MSDDYVFPVCPCGNSDLDLIIYINKEPICQLCVQKLIDKQKRMIKYLEKKLNIKR